MQTFTFLISAVLAPNEEQIVHWWLDECSLMNTTCDLHWATRCPPCAMSQDTMSPMNIGKDKLEHDLFKISNSILPCRTLQNSRPKGMTCWELTANNAFRFINMCCGVMVAATFAGAEMTKEAASAVVICSSTTLRFGTRSSNGFCEAEHQKGDETQSLYSST